MIISEITGEECREVLARGSIGRLGCSLDNQPYVVPICFAYELDYFLRVLNVRTKNPVDARKSQCLRSS